MAPRLITATGQNLNATARCLVGVLGAGEGIPFAVLEDLYTFVASRDPSHDAVAVAAQLEAWSAASCVWFSHRGWRFSWVY